MQTALRKAALAAAFLVSTACVPAFAAGPSPEGVAVTGTLPGGGTYVVRAGGGPSVAAVALWYRAPGSGFENDPTPGIGRLAAATVAASQPITGTPLGRFVDQIGGRIAVSSYPNSVAISALVPAEKAGDVVRALTASYFAPVVTPQGLALAQRDVAEEAVVRQFNPEDAIGDALVASLFTDGPARYPAVGSPQEVRKIGFERVKAYAERAFRPSNAVLVVTGAVEPEIVRSAVPGRNGAPAASEPPLSEHPVAQPAPVSQKGSEAGAGLGWVGPPITSEREATALDFVTDYLFRPETGIVQRAVAAMKGTSVSGKFVTYHDPGVVLVTISGGDVEAARTLVAQALANVKKPLDAQTFGDARTAFVYHILSDTQTPGELADTYGWYTVEGNAAYAPGADGMRGRYFAAAQSLTPEFVAQTVAKYLDRPGATVAVTVAAKSKTTERKAK